MRTKLVYNERTWGIDLITEINTWCAKRDVLIKRASGEYTLNTGSRVYFPDVLLHGDTAGGGLVLQGWELKMPDVDIDNKELLENAKEKAINLSLDSFLVWNVTNVAIYKINEDLTYSLVKRYSNITNITKRDEVEKNSVSWKNALEILLTDILDFFTSGEIKTVNIVDILNGDGLTNFILRYQKTTEKSLKDASLGNIDFLDAVDLWWNTAKNDYLNIKNPFEPLAKIILMSTYNKFVVGHILRYINKSTDVLRNLDKNINAIDLLNKLNSIKLDNSLDEVFNPVLGEEYLPKIVIEAFIELNEILKVVRIGSLDTVDLQIVLRNIVERNTRRVYGQFTTPEELAVLANVLTIKNIRGSVMDPCCGTGTIIRVAYEYKKNLGLNGRDISGTLKAFDKLEIPLKLARISLIDSTGECQFEINKVDIKDLKLEKRVDTIISNPPYVQQEDIRKFNPEMIESVLQFFKRYNEKNQLPGKSDLYAYIPFKMWELLESNGRLGLIVSNSWLASDWGIKFYELLNKFYKVKCIVASSNGRWFKHADVVSTILVLEKRDIISVDEIDESVLNDEKTKYILLNESIESLIKTNGNVDFKKAKALGAAIRQCKSADEFTIVEYSKKEMDALLSLGIGKNALFNDMKFMLEISGKLIEIRKIFDIARGERRGWDKLFYPSEDNNIDPQYLKSVLLSSKEIKGFIAEATSKAFCCEDSIEYLKNNNLEGTLNWIKKFENEVNGVGKPLTKVLARKGVNWYTMQANTMADICISVNPGDRLFYSRLEQRAFVNQRLMRLLNKSNEELKLLSALLNSTLGCLVIESLGFGRGLGALDLNPTNLKNRGMMLNPNLLNIEQKDKIIKAFEKMEDREVKNILLELKCEDREYLDNIILEAFDLINYKFKIYEALEKIYKIRTAVK